MCIPCKIIINGRVAGEIETFGKLIATPGWENMPEDRQGAFLERESNAKSKLDAKYKPINTDIGKAMGRGVASDVSPPVDTFHWLIDRAHWANIGRANQEVLLARAIEADKEAIKAYQSINADIAKELHDA